MIILREIDTKTFWAPRIVPNKAFHSHVKLLNLLIRLPIQLHMRKSAFYLFRIQFFFSHDNGTCILCKDCTLNKRVVVFIQMEKGIQAAQKTAELITKKDKTCKCERWLQLYNNNAKNFPSGVAKSSSCCLNLSGK